MTTFFATLGQRPEAITMALDILLPRYHYDELVILHTDVDQSDITTAYNDLQRVLKRDYAELNVFGKTLSYPDGSPIKDIHDQYSAEVYHQALLEVLLSYRAQYIPIHLLISGGRKAMSIYAALAAGVLFGEHDILWTIHTPMALMQAHMFHAPTGSKDRVHMIQLPISPTRLLPGVMSNETVEDLLKRVRTSPRQLFLHSLTEEESRLADLFRQHPYSSNEELGHMLDKSSKTIENQLRTIYGKLFTYFDLTIEDKRKRQALLDVLLGRV